MDADVDVVIVGTGAAIVAEARRLAPTRLWILLIEATARIGGRAWTCDVGGLPSTSAANGSIPSTEIHGHASRRRSFMSSSVMSGVRRIRPRK
jgi:monoamine oxidase